MAQENINLKNGSYIDAQVEDILLSTQSTDSNLMQCQEMINGHDNHL